MCRATQIKYKIRVNLFYKAQIHFISKMCSDVVGPWGLNTQLWFSVCPHTTVGEGNGKTRSFRVSLTHTTHTHPLVCTFHSSSLRLSHMKTYIFFFLQGLPCWHREDFSVGGSSGKSKLIQASSWDISFLMQPPTLTQGASLFFKMSLRLETNIC